MKPYAVVEYPINYVDFQVGRNLGIGYVAEEVKNNWHENNLGMPVYFFNSEIEAAVWADKLAKNNVNKMYVVVKSMSTFICNPGEVKVAKFTEEGYFPV